MQSIRLAPFVKWQPAESVVHALATTLLFTRLKRSAGLEAMLTGDLIPRVQAVIGGFSSR